MTEAPASPAANIVVERPSGPKVPSSPSREVSMKVGASPPDNGTAAVPREKPRPMRDIIKEHVTDDDGKLVNPPADAPRPGADKEVPRGTESPGTPANPSEPDKKPDVTGKTSPWKLLDVEKKARANLEKEVQELKTRISPEQDRVLLTERAQKAEKRLSELENEIRFVSYEKSPEFETKFNQPYVQAWQRAMKKISQIPITDPASGDTRAGNQQDVWSLVNLPITEAQEKAEQLFGKFHGTAMAAREEILDLQEARSNALEEGKKLGSVREQQRKEQIQTRQKQTEAYIKKTWESVNAEFLADRTTAEYFTPKVAEEGKTLTPEETKFNELLDKGFKLVEQAWSSHPLSPTLTEEQRQESMKMQAAVRFRAASFGPLKHMNKQLQKKVSALEKDLAQFRESTPAAGGSRPSPKANGNAKPRPFRDIFGEAAKRSRQ